MKRKVNCYPFRIIPLVLALLTFVSGTGFSMNYHYCGGKLKHSALIVPADLCEGEAEMKMQNCHKHKVKDNQIKRPACCHSESEFAKSDTQSADNFSTDISKEDQHSEAVFMVINNTASTNIQVIDPYYRPPPLIKEVNIWLQSFLL